MTQCINKNKKIFIARHYWNGGGLVKIPFEDRSSGPKLMTVRSDAQGNMRDMDKKATF